MPIDLETIQRPKPTTITVETDDGEVKVTYDRNAMTDDLTAQLYSMLVRTRLSRVLLGWDVTMNGVPWQPPDLNNIYHWEQAIREQRQSAHEAWEKLNSQHGALTPELATHLPPLGPEPIAPDAPITAQDRREAYIAEWSSILAKLPNDFKQTIDEGILDDFLGGRWRMYATATGSRPKESSAKSLGSPATPTA